jgi:hypothetical protein
VELNHGAVQKAWLPFVVSYRTFLANPGFDGSRVLDGFTSAILNAGVVSDTHVSPGISAV